MPQPPSRAGRQHSNVNKLLRQAAAGSAAAAGRERASAAGYGSNAQSPDISGAAEVAQDKINKMSPTQQFELAKKWYFHENECEDWEKIAGADLWSILGANGPNLQRRIIEKHAEERRGQASSSATRSGPANEEEGNMRALGKGSRFSASELYGTGRRMQIYGRLPSTTAEGW